MRKINLIVLLILTCSIVKAQNTIFVIGSLHAETSKVTKAAFFTAIKNCKPDLILLELESSMMEKDFSLPKSLKGVFEVDVIELLVKDNPKILVRPFDIEGRNEFFRENNYFETQQAMNTEIFKMYEENSLSFENKVIVENYIDLSRSVNSVTDADLKTINSFPVDTLIKLKINSIYKNFHHILSTTKSLEKYQDHLKLDSAFWIKRNNEMASNILKFNKLYNRKKIVVITGTYHRYFLKELLKPQESQHNFKLKEFYDTYKGR
jgi:hypothetical protein